MANQVDDYVKRPMRYQNIDGLGELGIGIIWTGLTLLELLKETAPSGSIWHGKTTFVVCAAALLFVVLYGQKALKKRITYPRTGYVKYRDTGTGAWRIVAGLLTAVVVALAVVFVSQRFALPSFKVMVIALGSAGWGLMYALMTRLDAAWRWVVLVTMIVAPPAVAMLPLDPSWRDHLPFVLQGLIFMVSGAISLALYLRRNPPPEQVAE
jgi:hypothetical protein